MNKALITKKVVDPEMHMLSFSNMMDLPCPVRVGGCGSTKFDADLIETQTCPNSKLKAVCFDESLALETSA